MSIISDALKKAQERQSKSGTVKDLSGILSRFAASKTEGKDLLGPGSSKRPVLPVRIILIALLVGSVVFLMIFAQHLRRLQTQAPAAPRKKAAAAARPGAKKAPAVPGQAERPSAASQVERAKTSKLGYPSKPSTQVKPDTMQERYGIYERPADMPALTGIMYSQTDPQAILGGEFVSEGSVLGGYTVKKILPDRVKVIYEDREYEIRLL